MRTLPRLFAAAMSAVLLVSQPPGEYQKVARHNLNTALVIKS